MSDDYDRLKTRKDMLVVKGRQALLDSAEPAPSVVATPEQLAEIKARRERVMLRDNPSKLAEAAILINSDITTLLSTIDTQKKWLDDAHVRNIEEQDEHSAQRAEMANQIEAQRLEIERLREWKESALIEITGYQGIVDQHFTLSIGDSYRSTLNRGIESLRSERDGVWEEAAKIAEDTRNISMVGGSTGDAYGTSQRIAAALRTRGCEDPKRSVPEINCHPSNDQDNHQAPQTEEHAG